MKIFQLFSEIKIVKIGFFSFRMKIKNLKKIVKMRREFSKIKINGDEKIKLRKNNNFLAKNQKKKIYFKA